ncbi:MAG: hypothetical protein ACK44B_04070, partial [Flavobacteriales bacterium]
MRLLIFFFMFVVLPVFSQEGAKVIGRVTDKRSKGLENVRVTVMNGEQSFIFTNKSGVYELNCSPNDTLYFSYELNEFTEK